MPPREPMPEWAKLVLEQLDRTHDWVRQTARSVADLASSLAAQETLHRARHEELLSRLRAEPPQKLAAGGEREDTDRFELARGATVDLSHERQKQIVHAIAVALKAATLLAAGALLKWLHGLTR